MVETLSPEWVTGFVDGEGCFSVHAYRRNADDLIRAQVTAEFTVQLREDDYEVLEKMQVFFGCGHLSGASRAKARERGVTNARDQVRFKVRKIEDLIACVIPHFDRHLLQSKKLRDYLIWREIVMILEARNLWFRERRNEKEARRTMLTKVLRLAAELRDGRNPGLRRSPLDLVA